MDKLKNWGKENISRWVEPAIIIAVILYVMNIQKSELKTEIQGVKDEIKISLDLFRSEMVRTQLRQDTEIRAIDKKIDSFKNSLIFKK